ncbi:MAG: ATP-dependent Clp protease ATP-binding subunit [Myxococcales bacterium]|nr:ATP-dependent Clp protease ATP-binding subunit [Myxococcales bacterium]
MAVGLEGVEARAKVLAKKLAKKPGQGVSTAHLLLSLIKADGDLARLLAGHGVGEMALVENLTRAPTEPDHSVELALERAHRIADAAVSDASCAHLLLAIAREPRSAGYGLLELLGAQPVDLRERVLPVLHTGELPVQARELPSRSTTSSAPARPAARRALRPNLRRPPASSRDQVALATETESKRSRRTASMEPSARQAAAEPAEALADEPQQPLLREPSGLRADEQRQPDGSDAVDGSEAPILDPRRFPTLATFGRNLTELAVGGGIDPVVGRSSEIEQLLDVLSRRRANNPLLVGPPGVGKTAVVEGLALQLAKGGSDPETGRRVIIEVSAGALLTGTGVRGALSERLAALREEVRKADGRVVLFLDEIHAIVSQGEGPDSLVNELKTALARGELPCIGATTEDEYHRVLERDAALCRRFTRVDVGEPPPEDAVSILGCLAPHYEIHHGVTYAADALEAAVQMSVRFMPDGYLPDKALGLMDQAAARVRRRAGRVVDVAAVAEVVSERTGVPAPRLLMRDSEVLVGLEGHLERRVLGQEGAVRAIAQAVRKSAVGFRGRRPLGSFLFLGPTGVGKTEMAKAIGERLFPNDEIVRLDMSEFSEPHAVARLLGAPPGYVGHDEGGQLTEPVRRRGYRLVLLDEVEKAHPDVMLSLLPLLDEGHLSDGRGRRVDFTNTVVVMTSNLGVARHSSRRAGIGFGASAREPEPVPKTEAVLAAARAALPAELWNRIDEPLYFQPLSRQTVARVARGLLETVVERVQAEHGVNITVEDTAIDALIEAGGYDPELGARPMKRVVGRLVEAPLAELLLSGVRAGDRLLLAGSGRDVTVELAEVDAAE